MARPYFYHSTTKKVLVAFATIFDEITIETDHGDIITVPLIFAQKEKFIDDIQKGAEFDMEGLTYDVVMPRIGFELSGLNFAPERHVNPMSQFQDSTEEGEEVMMYNRIPYDITFDVFVASRNLEDSLKVTEQIIPFFNPELTLTIKDKQDFKLETNISVVLNSVALNIDYQGSLDSRRTILWTLNFTAKAFYYPDVRESRRIKQTVMNFTEKDFEREFERLTSTVDPITADRDDPHTIIDHRESNT